MLADRYAGDPHTTRGLQRVEESAHALLGKLKALPPGMKESFANSFVEGTETFLLSMTRSWLAGSNSPHCCQNHWLGRLPFNIEKGNDEP
jgi:hypothetical protein